MFSGCGTALVTPFRRDGSLDEEAMKRLVRRQVEAGVNFLVPAGTTGESPTLTHDELLRVVAITVEESAGRVPVLAGAGGNNTAAVIAVAKEMMALKVSGILSVTPYYNKPTQEGLYLHYKAIADAVPLPIVVYSIQGRTGINVEPATLVRLAEIENIVGVKESSGNIAQVAAILAQAPDGFTVLSGDDALGLPIIAMGGHGLVSVVSNEVPAETTELVWACLQNDFVTARTLQQKYMPLMEANFLESNPIPVKTAMAEMGLLQPVWRLPLCPPKQETTEKIHHALESLGLLSQVKGGGRHVAGAN